MSEPQPPVPAQYLVSYQQPKTNHILHLLLTIFTFGFWFPIWLIVAVVNANTKPQRRISAVYGAQYPGHPGPVGVPQLPASEDDMLDPLGLEGKEAQNWSDITVFIAICGGVLAFALGTQSVAAGIVIALGTAGIVWYRRTHKPLTATDEA